MAIGLQQAGLVDCFDAVYGTSGGALNAAWLLTGEAQRWMRGWGFPEVAAGKVTDPRRVLEGPPPPADASASRSLRFSLAR